MDTSPDSPKTNAKDTAARRSKGFMDVRTRNFTLLAALLGAAAIALWVGETDAIERAERAEGERAAATARCAHLEDQAAFDLASLTQRLQAAEAAAPKAKLLWAEARRAAAENENAALKAEVARLKAGLKLGSAI